MARARVGIVSTLAEAAELRGCSLMLTRDEESPRRYARAPCASLATTGRLHMAGQGVLAVWGTEQDQGAKLVRRVPSLALLVVLVAKPKKGSPLEVALEREVKRERNVKVVIVKKKGDVIAVDLAPSGVMTDAKPGDPINPSNAPSTPASGRQRIPPSKRKGFRSSPNVPEHRAPNVLEASEPLPRAPQAESAPRPPPQSAEGSAKSAEPKPAE